MSKTDLYSRQRLLPEIGSVGQERLRSSTFAPSVHLSDTARQIAIRYAKAAGWGEVNATRQGPPPPLTAAFRYRASAEVGLGALDVLSASLPHFDGPHPKPER